MITKKYTFPLGLKTMRTMATSVVAVDGDHIQFQRPRPTVTQPRGCVARSIKGQATRDLEFALIPANILRPLTTSHDLFTNHYSSASNRLQADRPWHTLTPRNLTPTYNHAPPPQRPVAAHDTRRPQHQRDGQCIVPNRLLSNSKFESNKLNLKYKSQFLFFVVKLVSQSPVVFVHQHQQRNWHASAGPLRIQPDNRNNESGAEKASVHSGEGTPGAACIEPSAQATEGVGGQIGTAKRVAYYVVD
ncbi:hypothetical protein B0H11DRAFT_1280933 [Mycena galericulata]|nr:hypothetical protein B0H11DRAFT_1280933 [Mycena galericulata]